MTLREYIRTHLVGELAALVVGVAIGRFTVSRTVETHTATATHDAAKVTASVAKTESSAVTKAADIRVVTRIVTKPGGERVVERWREAVTQSAAVATAAEVRYVDRVVYKDAATETATRITVDKSARFHLSLLAGSTIAWDHIYGAQWTAKIIGPFELGLFGGTVGGRPMAGVVAGVSWH